MSDCPVTPSDPNLIEELLRRAKLRRMMARTESERRDALCMEQAAHVIERLKQDNARLRVIEIDESEQQIAALLERAGIPVIAEIHPRLDDELGHVFTWPREEVAQLCDPT